MFYWSVKSLLVEKWSVLTAACGIALALLLALYLDAVFRGEAGQIVTFIERTPGDVWVLQDGISDLHMARSRLNENVIYAVRQVEGVASVTRFLYRDSLIGPNGQEKLAYVVGIPSASEARSAWERATGWTAPTPGHVVLPAPMARAQNLQPGDRVRVGDESFILSGVSRGTYSMANPLIFLDETDARNLFDMRDGANVLLVFARPDTSPSELAARINREVEKASALTPQALRHNDFNLAMKMGGALIGVLEIMGLAVAGLIVIFTAFVFSSNHRREFAIAKALGAPTKQLAGSALAQTAVVSFLGIVIGALVTYPLEAGLRHWVPGIAVSFSSMTVLVLGTATLCLALLSALLPLRYVLSVDPMLVFQD